MLLPSQRGLRALLMSLLLLLSAAFASQAQEANASVIEMSATLNLRGAPSTMSGVVQEIPGGTALTALRRNADSRWLFVRTPDGAEGWVATRYVNLEGITLADLPVEGGTTSPDTSPSATTNAAPAAPAERPDAEVGFVTLNFRDAPRLESNILRELLPGTPLSVLAQTDNGLWYQVRTADNVTGWVYAQYVNLNIPVAQIGTNAAPATASTETGTTESTDENAAAAPVTADNVVVPGYLGSAAWQIFAQGQAQGRNPANFSKIGDSITASRFMFYNFGNGNYDLGAYGYLQDAINHFASGANSFAHVTLSAGNGWSTLHVLDAQFSNRAVCEEGEIPLLCEYRISNPSIALIMFGTNDLTYMPPGMFQTALTTIVDLSVERGIIPVLSTIPNYQGQEALSNRFNNIVVNVANERGLPVWDYRGAMMSLPNQGLSADGIHPSAPIGAEAGAARFTPENIGASGYVVRNLTGLQMLDALYHNVIAGR